MKLMFASNAWYYDDLKLEHNPPPNQVIPVWVLILCTLLNISENSYGDNLKEATEMIVIAFYCCLRIFSVWYALFSV